MLPKANLINRINQIIDIKSININIKQREIAKVLKQANKALIHNLDILGSGDIKFEDIPWHIDIKTGYEWPSGKYYTDYTIIDFTNNADVKVPWEISRCHHLLLLGQAFSITHKEKYAKEIISQINSWIDSNPLMHSINWTCSMEVAIRAVNWLYSLCLISTSSQYTDEFAQKVSKCLYNHGFYIYNNLENVGRYNANHFMSDLVGLLYIGLLFKDTKEGNKWFIYALDEFYYEIRIQFLPSGFHYERSISYHRLVAEMVSRTILMLQHNGYTIPIDIIERVDRMLSVVSIYIKPNGGIPNIGDEDNGRFLPFIKDNFHNHVHLLDEYINCWLGKVQRKQGLFLFQDVGYAIFRTKDFYLFVNNGGLSKYSVSNKNCGTHTHNDLLSFELSYRGKDIIVDPGTMTYTSEINKRNAFRSTAKHNTLMVDDNEQFGILPNFPFEMYDRVKVFPLTAEYRSIKGSYEIHERGKMIRHSRTFSLDGDTLTIVDFIVANGVHSLNSFFHLNPSLYTHVGNQISIYDNDKIICKIKSSINNYQVLKDSVSKSYGIEEESETVIMNTEFCNELDIETKFIFI